MDNSSLEENDRTVENFSTEQKRLIYASYQMGGINKGYLNKNF